MTPISNGYPLLIGSAPNSLGFTGNIDEVSSFGILLSENEINFYMSTSLSGNESDLTGYWNFNEGESTILIDLTGNGSNGNIYGAVWSTDVPVLNKLHHWPIIIYWTGPETKPPRA